MSNENLLGIDHSIEFDEWIKDSSVSMDSLFPSFRSQDQTEASDLSWLNSLEEFIDPPFSMPTDDDYSHIIEYFSNLTSELTILMLHPKVVQKSYQNEKRFMAPQPLIFLIGDGWPVLNSEVSITISDSVRNRSIFSGQVFEENDRVDLVTQTSYLKSFKGVKMNYYKAVFKSLYVSEADKVKSINLSFNLDYGSQEKKRFSFLSKEIKIISKPSKKKFMVKANDCTLFMLNNRFNCVRINGNFIQSL